MLTMRYCYGSLGAQFADFAEIQHGVCGHMEHVVFSEADTFVCDFHRKQSWLRWMRTTKHDVAEQQERVLQLLNVRRLIIHRVQA